MVKPGEGQSTAFGPSKSAAKTSSPIGDRWDKFVLFLRGVEVWGGLTVNDFLAVYGFASFYQGVEVYSGLKTDTAVVTSYFYLTPSGTDEGTVGTFRFYVDDETPLPGLQLEQLIAVGDWAWVSSFKYFSG